MGDSWEQQIVDTNGQSSNLNPDASEFLPEIPDPSPPAIEATTEAVEDLSINEDAPPDIPEDVEEEDERYSKFNLFSK